MSAALIRVLRVALASLVLALTGCRSLSTPVETPEYLRARAEILSPTASTEHDFTVHSHNDFEQEHPLLDALGLGYRSAEVDVIDRGGDVRVTHIGFFTQGTLKELYLDPLQKLVMEKGSVHGDGKPFYLWIEVRAIFSSSDIVPLLRGLLAQYPMFESFDARGQIVHPGPVVAIVCGFSSYREDLFRDQAEVPAYLSGNSFDVRQPSKAVAGDKRLKWLSLRWARYVDWGGDGPIPLAQLERLERLVVSIHQQGLKMRFFSNPQTKAFWDLMREAGVDQAGTDELARTRALVPDRFFAAGR